MLQWVKTEDRLPENIYTYEDVCATYYFVKIGMYGTCKAMFLDGEWFSNYYSKIIVPVEAWLEDTEVK